MIFDRQLVKYYKISWYAQVKEKHLLPVSFCGLHSQKQIKIIKQNRNISNFQKIEKNFKRKNMINLTNA